MLMKYKDFKTMSTNEMKNIKGGYVPEDGGAKCKSKCYKSNGSGGQTSADCKKGTATVGNTTVETCDCSLAGATSCYDSPVGEP